MDTPDINFLNGLTSDASFFDISICLREKNFDVVCGTTSFREPPKWAPPKSIFLTS